MFKSFVIFLVSFVFAVSVLPALAQQNLPVKPEVPQLSAASKQEAIDLLSAYLKIPSVTGAEREAGEFLANYCEEKGLYVTRLTVDEQSINFAATLFPLTDERPVIWLQNHIDVVSASTEDLWRYEPFSGTVAADTIWGRGAIDNKGQAVMQLMALLNARKAADSLEFPYNIGILSFSNEERDKGLGAEDVLERFYALLKPLVVYGEGGAGFKNVLSSNPEKPVVGISVAEKESLWLRLELELNSFGHGAAPAPEYANKLMINALARLGGRKLDLQFNRVNKRMFRRLGREEGGIRGFMMGKLHWWALRPLVKKIVQRDPMLEALTTNTITVTKLENPPGPPNKISTKAIAYLDCRLQPNVTQKAFIRRLERLMDEPRIKIEVINASRDVKPSPVNDFYEALEWAVKKEVPDAAVIPILFPATTDNGFFRMYDVPTYGLVPAILSEDLLKSVHSVNERLPVAALEQGINIYSNMLLKLEQEGVQKRKRLLNADLRKLHLLED